MPKKDKVKKFQESSGFQRQEGGFEDAIRAFFGKNKKDKDEDKKKKKRKLKVKRAAVKNMKERSAAERYTKEIEKRQGKAK